MFLNPRVHAVQFIARLLPEPHEMDFGGGPAHRLLATAHADRACPPLSAEGGAEWLADECRPVRCSAGAGSAPGNGVHPDTVAALGVLAGLQFATVTDEHACIKGRSPCGVDTLWCCSGPSFE
jgi:hypothetical protein